MTKRECIDTHEREHEELEKLWAACVERLKDGELCVLLPESTTPLSRVCQKIYHPASILRDANKQC